MLTTVSRFTPTIPWGWDHGWTTRSTPAAKDDGGTLVIQKLRALELTRQANAQLQVHTDEGDTVAISLHAETDLTSISYRYRARGPQGRESLQLRAAALSSSQDIRIQVTGSLSEQELEDIRRLVDGVMSSLGRLASGDENTSVPAATSADDPANNTLADYTIHMDRSETFRMLVLRMREWIPAGEPDAGSSKPAPVLEVPSQPSPTPDPPSNAPSRRPLDLTDILAMIRGTGGLGRIVESRPPGIGPGTGPNSPQGA